MTYLLWFLIGAVCGAQVTFIFLSLFVVNRDRR